MAQVLPMSGHVRRVDAQRGADDRGAADADALFATVAPNAVQAIRAFRVTDLQREAVRLGHHFLYAHCAHSQSKPDVLAAIAQSFCVTRSHARTVKGLYGCLTAMTHKAGPQQGFVVVLEQLPNTEEFDREARETLLDIFRDAADWWAERKVPFRVFYSFA